MNPLDFVNSGTLTGGAAAPSAASQKLDFSAPFHVGADQAAAPASGLFPAIGLALAAVALALALRK